MVLIRNHKSYVKIIFLGVLFLTTISVLSGCNPPFFTATIPKKKYKVLLLNYDPHLSAAYGNKKVSEYFDYWPKIKDLTPQYQKDLALVSGGWANYEIAQWLNIDKFPEANNVSLTFTPDNYVSNYNTDPKVRIDIFNNGRVNYHKIIEEFKIVERVELGMIDVVWIFAPALTGFYETAMAGNNAYWVNGIVDNVQCSRRFVIYGFIYERDEGCMLENTGHMIEQLMEHRALDWPKTWTHNGKNYSDWSLFTITDNHNYPDYIDRIVPGFAQVGTIHYPPNGEADYNWDNTNYVISYADDWIDYPNFTGTNKLINANEWLSCYESIPDGILGQRSYILWWLNHIPKYNGKHGDILNNWWRYILDFDNFTDNPNNPYLATQILRN